MSAEVERVCAVLRTMPDSASARDLAAAAMRETLLIAAETWQHLADYDKDPIAKAVADWLTARAKEE